jgi:hypothetical protein
VTPLDDTPRHLLALLPRRFRDDRGMLFVQWCLFCVQHVPKPGLPRAKRRKRLRRVGAAAQALRLAFKALDFEGRREVWQAVGVLDADARAVVRALQALRALGQPTPEELELRALRKLASKLAKLTPEELAKLAKLTPEELAKLTPEELAKLAKLTPEELAKLAKLTPEELGLTDERNNPKYDAARWLAEAVASEYRRVFGKLPPVMGSGDFVAFAKALGERAGLEIGQELVQEVVSRLHRRARVRAGRRAGFAAPRRGS